MRNVDYFKKENEKLTNELSPSNASSINKRIRKMIEMNDFCIVAIESIGENSLLKQKERLIDELNVINRDFRIWKQNTPFSDYGKDARGTYERITKLKEKAKQLSVLNEILM